MAHGCLLGRRLPVRSLGPGVADNLQLSKARRSICAPPQHFKTESVHYSSGSNSERSSPTTTSHESRWTRIRALVIEVPQSPPQETRHSWMPQRDPSAPPPQNTPRKWRGNFEITPRLACHSTGRVGREGGLHWRVLQKRPPSVDHARRKDLGRWANCATKPEMMMNGNCPLRWDNPTCQIEQKSSSRLFQGGTSARTHCGLNPRNWMGQRDGIHCPGEPLVSPWRQTSRAASRAFEKSDLALAPCVDAILRPSGHEASGRVPKLILAVADHLNR